MDCLNRRVLVGPGFAVIAGWNLPGAHAVNGDQGRGQGRDQCGVNLV